MTAVGTVTIYCDALRSYTGRPCWDLRLQRREVATVYDVGPQSAEKLDQFWILP